MRKPEWHGIATAVGIVLIITMVFWLGLNGPIDINKIKDWQTLITGVLALVAAGGAYWGATAKVRFDREVADGELKRRKLALYLKLEFTFAQLYDRAKIVDERFTFPPINEAGISRSQISRSRSRSNWKKRGPTSTFSRRQRSRRFEVFETASGDFKQLAMGWATSCSK